MLLRLQLLWLCSCGIAEGFIDGLYREQPTEEVARLTAVAAKATAANYKSWQISGTCSDPGRVITITENTCGLSMTAVCSSDQSWTTNQDLTACADGNLNFFIRHVNSSGDEATMVKLVTKDIIAPVVGVTYPFQDGQSVGYKLKVKGTCTNASDTNNVEVTLSGSSTEATTEASCLAGNFSAMIDASLVELGVLNLEVKQTDTGGNVVTVNRSINKNSSACNTLLNRQSMQPGGFAGGAGTISDPYHICTADQLADISNATSEHFVLSNDIYFELGDTNGDFAVNGSDQDYTSGVGWAPLAGSTIRGFDGKFHTISGLRINRPTTDDVGLIATLASTYVRDIHFIDANVTGQDNTAVVAGRTDYGGENQIIRVSCQDCTVVGQDYVGTMSGRPYDGSGGIVSSWVKNGNVSGRDNIGGIVGWNGGFGFALSFEGIVSGEDNIGGIAGLARDVIYQSYADAQVTATGSNAGGITGQGSPMVNVYATGTVSSAVARAGCINGNFNPNIRSAIAACTQVTAPSSAGYIVGTASGITDSYYSNEMTCAGCNTSGTSVTRRTDFFARSHVAFTNWDFRDVSTDGKSEIWVNTGSGLPKLFFEEESTYTSPLTGSGTAASPYHITTAQELVEVSSNPFYVTSHFQLQNNINMSVLAPGEFVGLFRRIPFEGVFDGNDFKIENMSIVFDKTLTFNKGIGFLGFGYDRSLIKNLHVETDALQGYSGVGPVCGVCYTRETLTRLKATGPATILAGRNAGGLIGRMDGSVEISEAHHDVTCDAGTCGGLVGDGGDFGSYSDVYATGNINGLNRLGGVFGIRTNGASVFRAYGTGDVNGTVEVAGLSGSLYDGIFDSFSLGNVIGVDPGNTRVGLMWGLNGTATGNYTLNTATCTNNAGADTCHTNHTLAGPLSYFYDKDNPPLNTWDFVNVWQENAGALPTLRNMPP